MTTLCTPLPAAALDRRQPPAARRMLRCECSGQAFAEVARLVRCGLSQEQACERTGCGRTCSACLPDLEHFLHASRTALDPR